MIFQDHNCVRELRTLVNTQQQKMGEMQTEILEAKLQLNEQKREIQMLKVLDNIIVCNWPLWILFDVHCAFSTVYTVVSPLPQEHQQKCSNNNNNNNDNRSWFDS